MIIFICPFLCVFIMPDDHIDNKSSLFSPSRFQDWMYLCVLPYLSLGYSQKCFPTLTCLKCTAFYDSGVGLCLLRQLTQWNCGGIDGIEHH